MWLGTQPMPPVIRVVTIPPGDSDRVRFGRHYCGERGTAQRAIAASDGCRRRRRLAMAQSAHVAPLSGEFAAKHSSKSGRCWRPSRHVKIDPEVEGKLYWIIEVDGEPAGQVQIAVDGGFRQQLMSTLGYTVAEAMQGRGVATAAVREAIRIAFGPLVSSESRRWRRSRMSRSRRVLEKAGFQFEGIRRGLLRIQGKRVDHACYGILVTDPWEH